MGASAITFAAFVGACCIVWDMLSGASSQVMSESQKRQYQSSLLKALDLVEGVKNGHLRSDQLHLSEAQKCYLDSVSKVHTKVRVRCIEDVLSGV